MTERRCYFCDQPVDPDDRMTWRATSVFSRTHGGGSGANRVVVRYLDIWAHDLCVSKWKSGRHLQESML
jgi:hypothetical protein